MEALAARTAQIPESFYIAVGVLVLMNLSTIVTVVGAAFRMVYKFAVLDTSVKALHRRLDKIEDKKYPADED